jgi:ferredoxin
MSTAAIFEFADINARMRQIAREIHDAEHPLRDMHGNVMRRVDPPMPCTYCGYIHAPNQPVPDGCKNPDGVSFTTMAHPHPRGCGCDLCSPVGFTGLADIEPGADEPMPRAAVYDFRMIAEFAQEIAAEEADAVRKPVFIPEHGNPGRHAVHRSSFWDAPRPAHAAVFDAEAISNRLAQLRGDAPSNTLWANPMLSESDERVAMYRRWGASIMTDGSPRYPEPMDSWIVRSGHEYDIRIDGCSRCGHTCSEIEELDLRICKGRIDGEACIHCGEKAYVSLSHTKWGTATSEKATRFHHGRCLACGCGSQTDLANPREGHRFLPERKGRKLEVSNGQFCFTKVRPDGIPVTMRMSLSEFEAFLSASHCGSAAGEVSQTPAQEAVARALETARRALNQARDRPTVGRVVWVEDVVRG